VIGLHDIQETLPTWYVSRKKHAQLLFDVSHIIYSFFPLLKWGGSPIFEKKNQGDVMTKFYHSCLAKSIVGPLFFQS
jgi:hypothetical protein